MGVLDLHNECPPMNYGLTEAQEVARGLGIGEVATAATLRALADCLLALASMDDTVNSIMTGWSAAMGGDRDGDLAAKGREVQASYTRSFEALVSTVGRIDQAVQGYRELARYAEGAVEAGRGVDYEQALIAFGGGFNTLVSNRIERLRTLKVRIKVLKQLQELGGQLLASNNYPDFFLLFMQPFRDMSMAANELYSEVVRGALISHKAMLNVCQLPGEDIAADSIKDFLQPVVVGESDNGRESHVISATEEAHPVAARV
jgi:hypothetical protein